MHRNANHGGKHCTDNKTKRELKQAQLSLSPAKFEDSPKFWRQENWKVHDSREHWALPQLRNAQPGEAWSSTGGSRRSRRWSSPWPWIGARDPGLLWCNYRTAGWSSSSAPVPAAGSYTFLRRTPKQQPQSEANNEPDGKSAQIIGADGGAPTAIAGKDRRGPRVLHRYNASVGSDF